MGYTSCRVLLRAVERVWIAFTMVALDVLAVQFHQGGVLNLDVVIVVVTTASA